MMLKSKLSYQRLRQEATLIEDDDDDYRRPVPTQQTPPSWSSSSSSYRRRWRLRISGLKRFFFSSKNGKGKGNSTRRRRRRRRPISLCRLVWAKVVKRLKESQAHFGELFAGNYLFLQVTPDYPFSSHYNNKKYNTTAAAAAAAYLSSASRNHNMVKSSMMMIGQKKVDPDHQHRLSHFPGSPSLDLPPPLYLSSSRVLTFN